MSFLSFSLRNDIGFSLIKIQLVSYCCVGASRGRGVGSALTQMFDFIEGYTDIVTSKASNGLGASITFLISYFPVHLVHNCVCLYCVFSCVNAYVTIINVFVFVYIFFKTQGFVCNVYNNHGKT